MTNARVRAWCFDVAVAAGVGFLAVVDRSADPLPAVVGLLMAVALLARRHRPVGVLLVVYALAPVHLLAGRSVRAFDVAVLVAMYSVVKYADRLAWGVLAGAGAGVGVLVVAVVDAYLYGVFWTSVWLTGTATVAAWFTGYGVRAHRLYVVALEERAATLERERDHLTRLAAAAERAAIARELHDVVAHSLSVMVVQADGARYALASAPGEVPGALEAIATTGRDALGDMHRIVDVLRGAGPPAGPDDRRRPGLAELDRLLDGARAAGVSVTRETVGAPVSLSVAEELTVYRIAQESVTNVLRHAGPGAALTLRVVHRDAAVSVEVHDDGGPEPADRPGVRRPPERAGVPGRREPVAAGGARARVGGHGLDGMRERAALHGGTLAAGRRPDGGWSVTATLPLTAATRGAETPAAEPSAVPARAVAGGGAA